MSDTNTADIFTFCSRSIIFTTCADYDDDDDDECETITAVATGPSVERGHRRRRRRATPPSPFHSIAKPKGIRSDPKKERVTCSMLELRIRFSFKHVLRRDGRASKNKLERHGRGRRGQVPLSRIV